MKDKNELCESAPDGCNASELAAKHVATYKPHYTSRYDDESWEVRVRLPGVQKPELSVTVENEILEISATRTTDLPDGWNSLEEYPSARRYQLRLDVGPEVDPTGIEASLSDGILSLRLPLKEALKPVSVVIN